MPALGPVADPASLGSPDGDLSAGSVAASHSSAAPAPVALGTAAAAPAASATLRTKVEPNGVWAQERLAFALEQALAARYDEALEAVREVVERMQGQPLGEDALRGEDAIRRRMELDHLHPDGKVHSVVKHMAADDMRGTRWARLFS